MPPDVFHRIRTPIDGDVELWRRIPAGEACIGSLDGEGGAYLRPRRHVQVVRPFWLSAVPVTRAQYSWFDRKRADRRRPTHPVGGVTWDEARAFCRWLADEHGFEGARLPTEDEWEVACRAGTTTRFWSGESAADLEAVAWSGQSDGATRVVGAKPANPWGLYDMHGNVYEWTATEWTSGTSRHGPKLLIDPASEPAVASEPHVRLVVRGGSCMSGLPDWARSAFRTRNVRNSRWQYQGFRVLLPTSPRI